jgi:hypothetical protein
LGLVDPGADDTVFSTALATQVGIDLSNAPSGSASGIGLVSSSLLHARVKLRIATATEHREWEAWVGFTTTQLRFPLLGFAGFLQYFTATFHGDTEQLELTVNATYPGT